MYIHDTIITPKLNFTFASSYGQFCLLGQTEKHMDHHQEPRVAGIVTFTFNSVTMITSVVENVKL